ncbi:MAG TPA: hypothetical protein VMW56_01010 [Candidatus Margulisiibacteriota bacterium]|nr:hypothetical protein [Candidatus Margulisiibacteriota bacterium]
MDDAEYRRRMTVNFSMRRVSDCLPAKIALVVFLALTVFVSVVRPLTRPTGRLYARFGVTRMSLLTEPAGNEEAGVLPPTDTVGQLVGPCLSVGVLLLVLKTRRVAFQPLRVRRAKRPPRRPASSLLTDPR